LRYDIYIYIYMSQGFKRLMKTEGSLPRSQKPDTCPNPKPHKSYLSPKAFPEHRF